MCLGLPGRVVETRGATALVDFGDGVIREVLLGPVEAAPGDVVVVHAGVAIARLDERAARRLMERLGEALDKLLDRMLEEGAPLLELLGSDEGDGSEHPS